jgi:hypothetical protein
MKSVLRLHNCGSTAYVDVLNEPEGGMAADVMKISEARKGARSENNEQMRPTLPNGADCRHARGVAAGLAGYRNGFNASGKPNGAER